MPDPASSGADISVVVPAFNEEALLAGHLRDILSYAAASPYRMEILVVDDGSVDSTAEEVAETARRHGEIRLLRQPENRGKGSAVRRGLLAAGGRIRGFTDADGATPIEELDRLLPRFDEGAQLVIGSRAKRQRGVRVDARRHRKVLGRLYNSSLRLILDLRDTDGAAIQDTQCGFKWLTAGAAEAILPRTFVDGFAFDIELLYLANRLRLPVAEVPVNWADRGASAVDLLRDPFRMLGAAVSVARHHRSATP